MIGSGLAGVLTALELATLKVPCVLVVQEGFHVSSSYYAQGGIAAFLPENTQDSLDSHIEDTLSAGAGHCDAQAVRAILEDASSLVATLNAYGVVWDTHPDGTYAYGQEGSHACRRILHVAGDATGKGIMDALKIALERPDLKPYITLLEGYHLVSLIQPDGKGTPVRGAVLVNPHTKPHAENENMCLYEADATVLATGGYARLWQYATPPACNLGEGIVSAYEAGAEIKDLPFVQFHPTAFAYQGQVKGLISEALRGEGGRLVNAQGEYFMTQYHPLADLAPRDVVSRAIFETCQHTPPAPQCEEDMTSRVSVFLDMTHLSEAFLKQRFPSIYQKCIQAGIDMATTPIPVTPAAHYTMGGVWTDYRTGATSIEGLYAVGEVAYTGLHGANRLASNSLLECGVMARRLAKHLVAQYEPKQTLNLLKAQVFDAFSPACYASWQARAKMRRCEATQQSLSTIQKLLWQYMGVVRTQKGMQTLLEYFEEAHAETALPTHPCHALQSMYDFLILLVRQALMLPQSQGAHTLHTSEEVPVVASRMY
jgi:L-aspartate oxidase